MRGRRSDVRCFTAKHVTAITGISYQTLNLWARTGLVAPSIAAAAGTGTERVYNFRDLVALRVAVELRRGGIATRAVAKVVQFLRLIKGLDVLLSDSRLVVVGNDVLLVRSPEELVSVLRKPGQAYLAFVLDLPKTVRELERASTNMRVARDLTLVN